jgi:hypothetical protein
MRWFFMQINTDALSYWFFRLNGFLTSVNFVIHTERRGEAGTDVDLLGVRFPYRAELFERPMIDHSEFTRITACPYIAIAEVKRRLCDLNGPWITRERRIVDRVLRAVGVLPLEDVTIVAESLHSVGFFMNSAAYVSLVCVGEEKNAKIQRKYPSVPQILWPDILSFIFRRFRTYRRIKSWHQHWDQDGHNLWECFRATEDENHFIGAIEILPN